MSHRRRAASGADAEPSGRAIDAIVLCGLPPNPTLMHREARYAGVGTSARRGDANGNRARGAAHGAADDANERALYHAGVLDECPKPTEEAPARYPAQMATLALPRGVDVYSEDDTRDDGATARYPAILTDAGGDRIYVACVSFIAAVPERSRRTMNEAMGKVPEFARACVCLVSRMPCLDAWMEALGYVFEAYFNKANGHLPVLSTIATRVVERLRWQAERTVLFPIGKALVAVPPKGAADHGAREAFRDGKEPLVRCCDIRTILACVCVIATERRLLLRSAEVSLLVKCAEALRGLAHPLVWRHVYIPCVAVSMVDYLGAPMPYIMGAARDVKVDERALDGVVVLDLDDGTLADGGESIDLPPTAMMRDYVQRVRRVLKPGVVDADEKMAETVTTWTTEINRQVTAIFTDFWYDLLQLADLHRHVEDDGSGKLRVKTTEYQHTLGYRRCALTESIMETNAFLSLLSDAASFAQRKSPRATDKTFALAKGNRAKFRSTQLTSASTILPPSVTQRGPNACVLIPRIHVLNFDDDQNKTTLRSLSLYTPETKFMSADSASAGALDASLSDPRGGDDDEPESGETLGKRPHETPRKRASWGWLKDRIKRAVGSDSLSPAQAIVKTMNQSGDADAMKFDWFYNTLTKKDAANLAELVREYRQVYSAADADEDGAQTNSTLAHRPAPEDENDGEFDADVDAATALVYPIFTNSDDVVASALAEHAANVNYVALLTGIARELNAGTTRFNIVSTALHAAVLRADAAGDAKSLAHAIRIVRKFQPQNTRKLWLKGSARWDDVNLWHGLISVNARVAWLRGHTAEARMGDLARCFALVGLNCLQSSELLGQLQETFDESVTSSTQAQSDGTLSAPAYTSVSFECWIEALRESGAAHYGRNDHVIDLKAVPDCCPSEVIESQIWRRRAITAMCVQSGIVSSLVALGSGRGDVAFFAPDSDATSRSQPNAVHSAPVTAMTFIPRSSHVFCARRDGSVEIWDSATCTRLSVVRHAHGKKCVSFVSPVVNQVISSVPLTASAGDDGTVKLWDARQSDSTRSVSVIKGHAGGVTAFATRDARGGAVGSVLTGDAAGVVRAWDPRHASAGPVALAHAHRGKVTCLAPLQLSDSTASAGEDGVVRVLRLDGESGGDICLSGHLSDITSLAVLQDETRGREPVGVIASGSADGELCLWSGGDLIEDARRPWRCVSKSRAHVGAVTNLAIESTGRPRRPASAINAGRGQPTDASMKSFLSASTDGSFARWNLATARLRGHVAATSWSPSSMRVPPRRASTETVCAVIEASRARFISGDRFGTLRRASLPKNDILAL